MLKKFFSTESIIILIIINALLLLVILQPVWLQRLENSSYDFSLGKNRTAVPSKNRIVVIAVDEASQQALGQWPWNRAILADMLDTLTRARVKSIGLQFPLDKATPAYPLTSLEQLQKTVENGRFKRQQKRLLSKYLKRIAEERNADKRLAMSIRKAPNVILAIQPASKQVDTDRETDLGKIKLRGKNTTTGLPAVSALRLPLEDFYRNARSSGYVQYSGDRDGLVRQLPLVVRYKNTAIPSFALLLAARSQGISPASIRLDKNGIKLGKRQFAHTSVVSFYPAFVSSQTTTGFKQYSFAKVLNGEVPARALRGRTVIIGPADSSDAMTLQTPAGNLSAPMLTASIVSSLIDENYFSHPAWMHTAEAVIFILVLLYLFFVIPRFSTAITALVSLLLLVVLVGLNLYFLLVEHSWLKILTAAFVLVSGHGLYALYHYLSVGKRRFLAESSEAIRMLVTSLQAQGQIDMAMDKLRSIPRIDAPVLGLAYNIAQDYESKRQYGKAISAYDFILSHDKNFRDTAERKQRAKNADNAVLVKNTGSIVVEGVDTIPTLGHYEVEKEIGRGAMGVVYLGHDPKINRTVAIKTLSLADEFEGNDLEYVTRRFFKEAEVAGKLNHPNIVTVYDAGQEHDLTYMAMEYIEGHDLTHYIKASKKPKVDWVLDIIWHVAGALDYAHAAGIVHRDIKPANIMYIPEEETVKITDFGIARVADSNTTKTGTALGTPSYMSPEQISGEKVKGTSDFFSLGVTMYELLTGELPFKGDSLAAIIYQITTKRQKPVTQLRKRLPPCVKTIVDRLLQKDPKKRYQDGASIQEAIERCLKR